jgi:hypothetical protein
MHESQKKMIDPLKPYDNNLTLHLLSIAIKDKSLHENKQHKAPLITSPSILYIRNFKKAILRLQIQQ